MLKMARGEFELSDLPGEAPGRKGVGVFCRPVMLVSTFLVVCVIITAACLMTYYIPFSLNEENNASTKQLVIQNPATTKTPAPFTNIQIHSSTSPQWTERPSLPATVTMSPPLDIMKGRLPKTVLPRRYEVNLRPYLYEDDVVDSKLGKRFTFDGWVRIKVECIQPTDEITLHSRNLTIHGSPTVRSVSTLDKKDIFESYRMVDEYAFVILKLKESLRIHHDYDIFMQFSGVMSRGEEVGFYPSMYLDADNNTRYIATTQMEGPFARRTLPCFDEPIFKASYDVQLEHRTDMQALSNGLAIRTIQLDGHWARTYFTRVPAMPTYLLAFIVHDYSSINVTNANGCLIRIWCQSDLINLAPYALNVANVVQTFFDEYLDSEYPLAKQDHIAIQDFRAGAMENWGLVTYLDVLLLYGLEGISGNRFYSEIITHELAHMWFGNLVTMEWWDDLWLNEGFATYMEHIGVHRVHPEFQKYEYFYVDTTEYPLFVDSLAVYPAIRAPVYAVDDDIDGQFHSITYSKGASILWMLEHFLTLDVFNQGVRNYLKERAYKNANAEHLWHELTYADRDIGKHDVKRIMDTWTLQRGYPLVTLTRTGNDVVATQKMFLKINITFEEDDFEDLGYKWYVPLTYVYESGAADQYEKPQQVWMNPDDEYTYFSLPDDAASDDWYFVNPQMMGFYRVNYEDDNWERLLEQAETDPDVFSEEIKVILIYETSQLFQAEVVPFSYYTRFRDAFRNNSSSSTQAAVSTASYVAKMLGSSGDIKSRDSTAVQTHMQQLVEPFYNEFGWDPNSMEDVAVTMSFKSGGKKNSHLDVTSEACRYGNKHCVSKAVAMFKDHMEDPNSKIAPNLQSLVYCNGIRYGGETEWDFAWKMLETSLDRRERSRWISALTCSSDSSRLKSYLQMIVELNTFHWGDVNLILTGVAANPSGYEVAWDFLRDNWEAVSKMFGRRQKGLGSIFEELTSNFNTERRLQELLDFGQSHDLGPLKFTYRAAIAITKANIRWMENGAAEASKMVLSANQDQQETHAELGMN